MALNSMGVSWKVILDHLPILLGGTAAEIKIDGDKINVYFILTTKSLVAILETGEVIKTNFDQVSQGISKMVGIKKHTGGCRIMHASGAQYTEYSIK